ncbi:hypothetical protein ACFY9G_39100 [Streptomyces anthocyanicus]|uniref:hypothetical protein n=1 Tax=Streptomyces anthocyanicus TaxID=68174 RepID=UPI0036EC14EA
MKIAPDATVTELDLPEADKRAVIWELLGSPDTVDQGIYQGIYHRRAVLHVHGNGRQLGLPQNLAAWALASAWRGTALYLLAGPVAITGRTMAGELTGLDGDLVRHARVVAQTVRETLTEWRRRPPVSNEAAISELLAYATRDISAST